MVASMVRGRKLRLRQWWLWSEFSQAMMAGSFISHRFPPVLPVELALIYAHVIKEFLTDSLHIILRIPARLKLVGMHGEPDIEKRFRIAVIESLISGLGSRHSRNIIIDVLE